jgi:hypothetical protein
MKGEYDMNMFTGELDFTKEFLPLLAKLSLKGVHYTVSECNKGYKINFDDGSDVALNESTYGCKDGLLEGYMGVFKSEYDTVTGYLTADDVIKMLGF